MGSGTVSTQREHTYIAIDLKSFYASVECAARGLDPLTTHLVVADETRTDKTICLAVSPSLKNYGIPGRARLFEVKQRLNGVNIERAVHAPGGRLIGESCDARDLERSPRLKASMVIAKPRMAHYLEISGQVYGIYLKYAAPEHIHVYSIDEVFIDAPCSGLGTLRRHPEIRWRIKPADIVEFARVQLGMLQAAAPHVAPGGALAYATCTVTREENNGVVKAFLESEAGAGFKLAPVNGRSCVATRLAPGSPDAHFAVRFERIA